MGGATPVLLKVLLFIKVGVATLKTLPRPILFLFQIALYQGFPMRYHLFHNSIWKVARIAKTSDCKISWRVFLQILNALYQGFPMRYHLSQKFFGKIVKMKETSFLSTWGITFIWHNCRYAMTTSMISFPNWKNGTQVFFLKVLS